MWDDGIHTHTPHLQWTNQMITTLLSLRFLSASTHLIWANILTQQCFQDSGKSPRQGRFYGTVYEDWWLNQHGTRLVLKLLQCHQGEQTPHRGNCLQGRESCRLCYRACKYKLPGVKKYASLLTQQCFVEKGFRLAESESYWTREKHHSLKAATTVLPKMRGKKTVYSNKTGSSSSQIWETCSFPDL